MLKRVNQQLLAYFLDFDGGSMPKFKHNLEYSIDNLLLNCKSKRTQN